jgi:predicted MPP superfamily phosphohydrolase
MRQIVSHGPPPLPPALGLRHRRVRWRGDRGIYTLVVEPHWLEITTRDLPVANLPVALDGARLAQLSDLHVGPQVDDAYLIASFDRLRALAPDIVTITGDFISHRPERGESQFVQLREVLSHLPRGRLATLGILGNHDYGVAWQQPEVAARVVQ